MAELLQIETHCVNNRPENPIKKKFIGVISDFACWLMKSKI